ncbi:hypothetical protein P3W85_36845 [Cupriavidus basilensis]|uniref:Uncharacterized protein n=2 Tax=Cupriavidus basilensis TaxID=68895 RepID=A0ABT6B0Q1_9BURK|nr:hypothetical protein [Cupriavidus basilensis]MDF3838462.1 hypothetical protein [Cupriavidus basilensis]
MPEPLAAGEYLAKCRETSHMQAMLNGHEEVFPRARCVSDGRWCTFFHNGTAVWECNASYAAAHFIIEPLTSEATY